MWPFKTNQQATIADQIQAEVAAAINSLNTNATTDQGVRSRIASAISGGYDGGDTMHNVYLDYGYPGTVTFDMNWNMYRRFGIARNVVELPVDTCWMTPPEVEASEAIKNDIDLLIGDLKLWDRVKGLDTRQRVGRYAGMFMRVRDGLSPDLPIEGKLPGVGALVQMIPLYEGQLKVLETEGDVMSDNYGLPSMYQLNSSAAGNRNEKIASSFSIHPSRIIVAAEGADDGGIYGIPALEACYNSLMDLRKIIGAGGEGFYKNAAQSIVFNLQDAASAKVNSELLTQFNENYDEFSRDRMRRAMWTPGLESKPLESSLITPLDFFNIALNDVSASSKMPATIIIGQQTGRLASGEDSKHFLSMNNSRRKNFLTELVTNIFQWCMEFGILPVGEFEIVWDDLMALSVDDKLNNSKAMSEINQNQFNAGGTKAFTGEEIRETAGFDSFDELDAGEMDDLEGDLIMEMVEE